jgi:hypothetical protein
MKMIAELVGFNESMVHIHVAIRRPQTVVRGVRPSYVGSGFSRTYRLKADPTYYTDPKRALGTSFEPRLQARVRYHACSESPGDDQPDRAHHHNKWILEAQPRDQETARFDLRFVGDCDCAGRPSSVAL